MPARITPGDAYRKLKPRYPDCLLAFGVGVMVEFVRSDAREVARVLQEPLCSPVGYDAVVIHSAKFYSVVRRLTCAGRSVLLLTRHISPTGRYVFLPSQRFGAIR